MEKFFIIRFTEISRSPSKLPVEKNRRNKLQLTKKVKLLQSQAATCEQLTTDFKLHLRPNQSRRVFVLEEAG